MSKDKLHQFEHPLVESEKSSKMGIFAGMAVLGIVGLVLWMIFSANGDR